MGIVSSERVIRELKIILTDRKYIFFITDYDGDPDRFVKRKERNGILFCYDRQQE